MIRSVSYILVLLFLAVAFIATGQTIDKMQSRVSNSQDQSYASLLDSARFYLTTDADLSIQYVEESLRKINTGKIRNKSNVATSYLLLGDIYFYWKAYDLAASNYLIALKDLSSSDEIFNTKIKLAKCNNLNKENLNSNQVLLSIRKSKRQNALQQVEIQELLGDNHKALGKPQKALDFYNEGLDIAQKRNLPDKVIVLNTKIGEIYAQKGDTGNAEKFYSNSINVAQQQSVQQEVLQNEKMSDYYRSSNQLDKEISLRKSNLQKIENLPSQPTDTLTAQSLNFDIADAYVIQKKYTEAIP